jgi:transposase
MAKNRKSPCMQEQIRQMHEQGISVRKIAEALGIARQTVRKFIEPGSEEEKEPAVKTWHSALDWVRIGQLAAKGVTVKQLHAEYAPEVTYWRFWHQLRTSVPLAPEVTLRQVHQPAERVEIDYADGINLVDAQTGERTKTHLFVGTLPFSSYVFGEFVLSQKLASFIESQERMWAYFGGMTPYVVVDNLKSGVHKAHRYDPDINPTYCAYAHHAGFAVLPARPYKPRDKPTVEANIGAIQRSFFQEVREKAFYSLAELNAAFAEFLKRFHATVMKEHGATRAERFATEKPRLKPLPETAFEMAEWRQAKVHPDCHVQVEKNFYSVPYRTVGLSVRVRLTPKLVEVFAKDTELLATHVRLSGTGKLSTHEAHYPEKKLGFRRFEVHAARKEAERIGPATAKLVETLVEGDYPLKHLRRIQGILRLHSSHDVSTAALEYGCEQALTFSRPRLQYVKACAEHFNAHGGKWKLIRPEREASALYLHEAKAEVSK